jgi:hypothetical protein
MLCSSEVIQPEGPRNIIQRGISKFSGKGNNEVMFLNNQLNHVFPFVYYQSGIHIVNRRDKDSVGISVTLWV